MTLNCYKFEFSRNFARFRRFGRQQRLNELNSGKGRHGVGEQAKTNWRWRDVVVNALVVINEVALRQTRLLLGWVTVCGQVSRLAVRSCIEFLHRSPFFALLSTTCRILFLVCIKYVVFIVLPLTITTLLSCFKQESGTYLWNRPTYSQLCVQIGLPKLLLAWQ